MNTQLSISPSLLESFRQARDGKYPKSTQYLHSNILEPYKDSETTLRGKALHKLLEDPFNIIVTPEKRVRIVVEDTEGNSYTHYFGMDICTEAMRIHNAYNDYIFAEEWGVRQWRVDGYDILMRMRIDAVCLNTLIEYKHTTRRPKRMDFYKSMQWRCYLSLFENIEKVDYHIFQLPKIKRLGNAVLTESHKYYQLQFMRESNNNQLIENTLREFIAYLQTQPNLLHKIEENGIRAFKNTPDVLF